MTIIKVSNLISIAKREAHRAKNAPTHYVRAANEGWKQGKKLSEIQKATMSKQIYNEMTGTLRKAKPRSEDLPYILGGVGFCIPIPGLSFVGYGTGFLLRFICKNKTLKTLVQKCTKGIKKN